MQRFHRTLTAIPVVALLLTVRNTNDHLHHEHQLGHLDEGSAPPHGGAPTGRWYR